jgi:hypothetical protein
MDADHVGGEFDAAQPGVGHPLGYELRVLEGSR